LLVEFLKNWIINIVVTMIFVVFVEILMPNSSMRKYIDFVMGLLVMLVILSPLINVAAGNFNMGSKILEVSGAINAMDVQMQLDKIKKGQEEGIVKTYKKKLEKQIEEQIMRIGLAENARAEVYIDDSYGTETFGTITAIRVTVMNGGNDSAEQAVQKVDIKVEITGDQQTTGEVSSQDEQLKEKISGYLADLYTLSPENVEVIFKES